MIHTSEIVLGKDLRDFVMELLGRQQKSPKLIDYLVSLWVVAEIYKNVKEIDFVLIAKMLDEVFDTTLKN